eukprot:11655228-Alexandrium_andersonii.AAC.1
MGAEHVQCQAAHVASIPPRLRTRPDGLGCPGHRGAAVPQPSRRPDDLSAHQGSSPALRHDPYFGCCRRANQA